VVASHFLGRQFLPVNSPPHNAHSIVFKAYPAEFSSPAEDNDPPLFPRTVPTHRGLLGWVGANITAPTRHAPPCAHNYSSCALAFFRLLEQAHLVIAPESTQTMEESDWYPSLASNGRCAVMHAGSGCSRSKLMGFHMYRTCGDQPLQGCGGIQLVLANFSVVALLLFVY
jgi:hypothetical protein